MLQTQGYCICDLANMCSADIVIQFSQMVTNSWESGKKTPDFKFPSNMVIAVPENTVYTSVQKTEFGFHVNPS